jgi:hypothetical protein
LALEAQDDRPDFPDPAWERYRQDGDLAALVDSYLGFFQATFQPSLLHSLEPFGTAAERQAYAQIPLNMVVLRRT